MKDHEHMHNFAKTYTRAIYDAVNECTDGRHVAHVTNSQNGRTVAIRPVGGHDWHAPGLLDLTFSDPKRDHRLGGQDEKNSVTEVAARDMIHTFLTSCAVAKTTATYFHGKVNQKIRPIDIVKVNRTRIRIEYELPRTGMTGAWRPYMDVGNYRYIGVGA